MRTILLASAALAATAGPAFAQSESITFYELPAYLGRSVTVTTATPDLAANSVARRAQSARVRGSWTVCTGADYDGTCRELTANVPALAVQGLNRRVVSVRPTDSEDDEVSSGGVGDLDVDEGVRGQDVEFYARPSLSGGQVSAGANDRTAADAFCRAAGYGSSAYSGRSRVTASNLVNVSNGARVRGYALRDVLCRR